MEMAFEGIQTIDIISWNSFQVKIKTDGVYMFAGSKWIVFREAFSGVCLHFSWAEFK